MEKVKKYWWVIAVIVLIILYVVVVKKQNPFHSMLGEDNYDGYKNHNMPGHGRNKHESKNGGGSSHRHRNNLEPNIKHMPRHKVVTNREEAIM